MSIQGYTFGMVSEALHSSAAKENDDVSENNEGSGADSEEESGNESEESENESEESGNESSEGSGTEEEIVNSNEALKDLFAGKHEQENIEKDLQQLYERYITGENIQEESESDDEKDGSDKRKSSKQKIKEEAKDALKKDKKQKKKEETERLQRTIFVGNVALTVTRKTLKKLFTKYGEVESVRIRSVPTAQAKMPKKVALIKKEFHSERDSMNAYVVFKNEASAQEAIQSNGYLLEDLHIRVDHATPQKKVDQKCCIFVGNLPFSVSEEEVRSHFTNCGCVEDVRLIRDKASGLGKGFGYVRFKSSDGVMLGLKLHGKEFKGRKIRVFRSKDNNNSNNNSSVSTGKPSFRGLRTTSKKEIEKGKKFFNEGSRKSQNAILRIKNKQKKQTKNKHLKNSQKNVRKKVNNKSKKK